MKVAAALSTPFQLHTGWPQAWPVAGITSVFWSPHMVQVYVISPSSVQAAALVTSPSFQM